MDIHNFEWYAPRFLKIKTKLHGLRPFIIRRYQLRFLHHLKNDFKNNIIRSVSLKPRQAGWSTLIAGYNTHKIATEFNERGIMLADKALRTQEVHGIYSTFVDNLDPEIKPMIDKNNQEEIFFDNPDKNNRKLRPGLGSGFKSETAQDPNAGRSGTRKWAHMTEHAFYPYASLIDEGVQNSIPLAPGTRIFKESTANGMTGHGAEFYLLCEAAMRGETIYKFFFVGWYEIDDYQLPVPPGFILNKTEIDLVKRCPEITNANLVWRRMKISEYSQTSETGLSPEERFKQDFPSFPEEAFLSTGRPVFDAEKLKNHINFLRQNPPEVRKIKVTSKYLSMFQDLLKVYVVPQPNKHYSIGADVAEGLELGDFSSATVLDHEGNEVATFHGHIDADLFGRCLVELAKKYNNAVIVPEVNNMGHTTVQAIKDEQYFHVYMREVKDEIDQSKITQKIGWRTTTASKQVMLNLLIAYYRDSEIFIRCVNTLTEMLNLTRGSNGEVDLGGKDRVVSKCLAIIGLSQIYEEGTVTNPNKKAKTILETVDKYRETLEG